MHFVDNKGTDKVRKYIKKKYNVEIGKYTYGYDISSIEAGCKIGSFCSIAKGVKIGLMNHPLYYVSTNPFLYYASRGFINEDIAISQKEPAVIEDDVWIGTNAVILPGVVVHKGAVIGAGAIVTKDVSPYAIVGGVPASVLRYRFSDEEIEKLLKIDWSNWNDDTIRSKIEEFYDIKRFIHNNL